MGKLAPERFEVVFLYKNRRGFFFGNKILGWIDHLSPGARYDEAFRPLGDAKTPECETSTRSRTASEERRAARTKNRAGVVKK